MLIRVASDLHLEQFSGQTAAFLAKTFILEDERDPDAVLVLAGDISSKPDQLQEFLQVLEPRFKRVIFIGGNHELYKQDYQTWVTAMNERFSTSLSNTAWALGKVGELQLDGVRFIFTTLWADGGKSLHERDQVGKYLNDFRLIRFNDKLFTVPDMMNLHYEQKVKLIELLKVPFDGKTVVITHHLPSYKLCHPRFGPDCNGGFASNCDEILESEYAPEIWIHGHTHDSVDTTLGKTRIVCNPAGYRFETNRPPHNDFKVKFVEL